MATIDDSAIQARLEDGAIFYEDGNLYEALVAWKEVLAIDPDNEVAQEYLRFVEENFQIGVDALLAHHEAALGGAPALSAPPSPAASVAGPPPPPPPPVPTVARSAESPDAVGPDLDAIDLDAVAIDLDAVDAVAIDPDAVDAVAIDLDAVDAVAIDLDAVDAVAPDLDAIDLDAVAIDLDAVAPDAPDLDAIAPDLDAIDLDAIDLDAIDLDAIDLDAVASDLDAIHLDAIELDAIDLDSIELEDAFASDAVVPAVPVDVVQPIFLVPAVPVSESIEIQRPRPPVRVSLPSEPALPLEPLGADSDAPSAYLFDVLGPAASIDDLPEGLPSSSIDVPLFADPNDFMRTPPSDFPQVQRPPTVEPLPYEVSDAAGIDPLAGMDPLFLASNIDAAFDALLAPEDSVEILLEDADELADAAPVALPLPLADSALEAVDFGDGDDAPFASTEAVAFEADAVALAEADEIVPVEADPVVPVEEDPVVPVEADPVVPVEADPVVPVEADPVVPVEADPVVPVEADPVVPVEADPVVPVEADPVVPVEADPVVPVEADPVVSVEADPVVPVEADPVVPVEADPVVPVEADPVVPVEADEVVSFAPDQFEADAGAAFAADEGPSFEADQVAPFEADEILPFEADAGAAFEADEGPSFEPHDGQSPGAGDDHFEQESVRAPVVNAALLETPQIAAIPAPTPDVSRAPTASRPGSGVRRPPVRVTPPTRRDSLPMRGEPLDSDARAFQSGESPSSSRERPSFGGQRPSHSVERPSSSVERPSSSVERPSSSVERPSSSVERPSSSVERPSRSGESRRQMRPPASPDRAGKMAAAIAPLRGHALDSIEEMDWSEILEEGAGAEPEMQAPEADEADEAFFIEMQSDRLNVEPGNEAAAWGVSGSPISAPILQHQSAPTSDPFVMPSSHFVDLPDEVFSDEPSIPDTWAAEAPEAEDLSVGSIDVMVDEDFQSWEQPAAHTDPFAQSADANDSWAAAASVFDEGNEQAKALLDATPVADIEDSFEGPLGDLSVGVDSIELPIQPLEDVEARKTQQLVSVPAPTELDAKPGPPPVAQKTPMSLPPLPGEPEDGPLYVLGVDDPLAARVAPDWLTPTFEPGPASPEPESLGDAFAPPGETDFFDLANDGPLDEDDMFQRAEDVQPDDTGRIDTGSILVETRATIEEAPTLELPDTSSLARRPLPTDPPLPGDAQPAAAAIFGRKRRGGAVGRNSVAEARRQEDTPPITPVAIAIDPDIEALLRSGFEDLDVIESTGSQSLEVRQRVPSRPASGVDVDTLMEQARQKQAAGDFSGSLELVEQVLLMEPNDPRAQAYMQENTTRLLDMYRSRLGPLTRMPRVKLRPEEIIWQALDHRAGFLLSQVDGRTSYEDLIEIAGMSELEATRTLARLVGYELIG